MKTIIGIFSLILCGGCLTWTPSAQDAANAVSLVAPQYAGQAAAVAGVVGTKAKSKQAGGTVSLDGFTPGRIYRVRGVVTEAKDISWTDIWSREGNAATDDISAQQAIVSPIMSFVSNSLPADLTFVDSPAANTDEAFAAKGAEDIAAIKAAKGKK